MLTLREFVEKEKARLTRFQEHWEKGTSEDAENWPARLNEEDWEEHFSFFVFEAEY